MSEVLKLTFHGICEDRLETSNDKMKSSSHVTASVEESGDKTESVAEICQPNLSLNYKDGVLLNSDRNCLDPDFGGGIGIDRGDPTIFCGIGAKFRKRNSKTTNSLLNPKFQVVAKKLDTKQKLPSEESIKIIPRTCSRSGYSSLVKKFLAEQGQPKYLIGKKKVPLDVGFAPSTVGDSHHTNKPRIFNSGKSSLSSSSIEDDLYSLKSKLINSRKRPSEPKVGGQSNATKKPEATGPTCLTMIENIINEIDNSRPAQDRVETSSKVKLPEGPQRVRREPLAKMHERLTAPKRSSLAEHFMGEISRVFVSTTENNHIFSEQSGNSKKVINSKEPTKELKGTVRKISTTNELLMDSSKCLSENSLKSQELLRRNHSPNIGILRRKRDDLLHLLDSQEKAAKDLHMFTKCLTRRPLAGLSVFDDIFREKNDLKSVNGAYDPDDALQWALEASLSVK